MLLNTAFMQKSFKDLIEMAKLGKESRKIIKKLEYYQWYVGRQDVEFQTQMKNLTVDLRDFTTFLIQEL